MIHLEKESFLDFNLWLKNHKRNYLMIQGGKSKRIKWKNCTYMFSKKRFSFKELGVMSHLKKVARDSNLFNDVKIKDKEYLFHKLRNSIQYNYMYRTTLYNMLSKKEQDIFAIDLDSAYTMSAFILGIIDKKTKDDLLKLKEWYKKKKINKNINALIGGAFASESITSIYENGKRKGFLKVENKKTGEDELKGTNELIFLWWLIAFFVDLNMRKICGEMKTLSDEKEEKKNKVTLAYYVDCIFMNMSFYPHDFLKDSFNDLFPSQLIPSLENITEKTGIKMLNYYVNGIGWGWKGTGAKLISGNVPANLFTMEKYKQQGGLIIPEEKTYIFGSKMFL